MRLSMHFSVSLVSLDVKVLMSDQAGTACVQRLSCSAHKKNINLKYYLFCIMSLCLLCSPHLVYNWFNKYIMPFSELSVQHSWGSM